MRRLFILGSQGIPAQYGGLETFADEIATRLVQRGFEIYVTCEKVASEPEGPANYEGVHLLYINAPANNLRTMVADVRAIKRCTEIAEKGDVIYLLGYGVGPFAWKAIRDLKAKGVQFWLNPDGLEWKRPRWSPAARRYLHFSERFLVYRADTVICDAAAIKDYLAEAYGTHQDIMEVIEYGAPILDAVEDGETLAKRDAFYKQHGLDEGRYNAYVGRFVPDNNLEMMIRGVLDSRVQRKLVVCAKYDAADPFYQQMDALVRNSATPGKVILAGGIYDRPLLQSIRQGAFSYFHGHEVGGTNPALVEAMGLGSFIIALTTTFNTEVLQDAALFFEKDMERFIETLLAAEKLSDEAVQVLKQKAQDRVRTHYNWERIADLYQALLEGKKISTMPEPIGIQA